MGKILLSENPDIPVLLPKTASMFCKRFIHEKQFPREWLKDRFTHGPKGLMRDLFFLPLLCFLFSPIGSESVVVICFNLCS